MFYYGPVTNPSHWDWGDTPDTTWTTKKKRMPDSKAKVDTAHNVLIVETPSLNLHDYEIRLEKKKDTLIVKGSQDVGDALTYATKSFTMKIVIPDIVGELDFEETPILKHEIRIPYTPKEGQKATSSMRP